MADEEQLAILRQGPEGWNAWLQGRPHLCGARFFKVDLSGADLREASLDGADFRWADLSKARLADAGLRKASLFRANLFGADLRWTHLSEADLREASLGGADLRWADLREATLCETSLFATNLSGADPGGADFSEAFLYGTVLVDIDLGSCKGLDSCRHLGPSSIDFGTLQRSGSRPLAFLRGVGLPDNLIDHLPSLLDRAIQFYSCFISYSSKDQAFVEQLHADLQAKGVRCWFAPHDMAIGAKILDAIDQAIRLRDKVLLVLSEGAIASDWVEGEVTRALEEERERKRPLLFPIRIDDTVLETEEAWARMLRGQRNIGDFTRWKDHDAYQKALERLLRDLKVEAKE